MHKTPKKNNLEVFLYNNLHLRMLDQTDLKDTLAWRNNYRNWFNDTREIDWEAHENWYKKYQQKDNDYVFIIEDFFGGKIGQASIYNINAEKSSAEFGRFLVNPEFSGQGFMKVACKALLMLSRDLLHIKYVFLEVKDDNKKAIHIYNSCGFSYVETLPNGNLLMDLYL